MDPMTMMMIGGTALKMIQGDAQAKRQNILDQADAKWSGFKQFQKSKAGANAPWVEGIMDGAGSIADYEQKNPGKTGALGKYLLGQQSPESQAMPSMEADESLGGLMDTGVDGNMYEEALKRRNIA